MNIRYPVRKADGRDYKNYDELLTDIRKNAHGWWLLGISRYWHGGIHIGTSSSPASVLDQETPEKSVPLQFMMDGEVVAWRVNRDYAHIECMQAQSLRQSGTFVLVKSVYKPDEQDESSWLTLYQLYMHIAPLSEFPKRPLYRVTQKGHGVRMRKHSRHDDNREIVPDVLANKHGNARTLMQGETLAVLQQKSFLLDQRLEPFALVQRLQNGKPAGDLFWVSMRPEYLELDGECYVCLPDWMHSALNHGVFDDVVVPPVPLKVTVKAGDPVGFLGAQDLADEDNYPQIITTDYKAHIELLSLDEHVTDVVANVKGIKTGKQFIKLKLKRPLYLRCGEGEESTFEQMSAITRADAGKIIPRDATYPFTDKTGVTYFQIRPHTWVHQDDVEQLSQHDLAGLNFDCIKAEHTTDFTRTLDERWVIDALKSISSHFDSEKGPASAQAKMFYDSLIHNAENRRPPDPYPDKSQDELLFGALHTNQMNIPEYARRLIVKHDSDWHSTYVGEDFESDDASRNKIAQYPHCVRSAFWFYCVNKNLSKHAKNDDFNMVTALINGGFNGYNDRLKYFNRAVSVFKAEHLNILKKEANFSFEDSEIYNYRVYAYSWGRYHDPLRNESGTDKDKTEALKAYRRAVTLYERRGDAGKVTDIENKINALG
ncbi:hypothetical protein ACJXWJ_000008 [Salmonella enterica]